jgi:hypothetical protein
MIKRIIQITLLIVVLGVGGLLMSPYSPLPGGQLSGEVVDGAIDDWSFAENERICHFEMNAPEARSITVTCIVADKQAYVGCMGCPRKSWHEHVTADPNTRYRVNGKIYNVTATRVMDRALIDSVWKARMLKDGEENPGPAPDNYWMFHLTSR